MKKIGVGVLGATGAVGQRFIDLLEDHPWFYVKFVFASEKNEGKKYKDAVIWKVSAKVPKSVSLLPILKCDPKSSPVKIVFSALDSTVAGEIEENFARKGCIVVSNSKNHRNDKYVPLLVPEVNPEHLGLIELQKNDLKSKGFIVTNPNCTTVGLSMVLKPLNDAFGVKKAIVTTMQALSGAGYPGVSSMDSLDNVVPFIGGEEEKVEKEPLKILGTLSKKGIVLSKISIDAHCNRVTVRDGHLETLTIEFDKKPSMVEVLSVLKNFKALPQKLKLPSAPLSPIVPREEDDRPQPVLDRNEGNGMSVVVGRIRKSNIFDIRLSLLVHNTIRGAAGCAILNAELLYKKNYL